MVGMAIAAAKFNPMVRFFSTPAVYIVTHLGLNALFGGLNAGGVLKNNIGGKIGNVIHALISLLVMINLGLNPLIYGGPEELKGQPLFWLLITHGIVNIIYGILVCVIPEEEANKTIKIIYSCVSSLVIILIGICGNPELREKIKKKINETAEAAKKMKDKIKAAPTEGAATENPVAAAPTAEKTADKAEPVETTKTEEVKAFGKRQRRRNPPKRRKKKY